MSQDYRLRYQLEPLVKEDLLQKEGARVRATVSSPACAAAVGDADEAAARWRADGAGWWAVRSMHVSCSCCWSGFTHAPSKQQLCSALLYSA